MFPSCLAAVPMLDPPAVGCQTAGKTGIDGGKSVARILCAILSLREVISMSTDGIVGGLTAATLEAKWRSARQTDEREDFDLRMRRALSWLKRAEQELQRDDLDAAFIFHWIAFNAAYGGDGRSEKAAFKNYFSIILRLGAGNAILDMIEQQCPDAIESFKNNEYVFPEFWTENTHQARERSSWEHLLIDSNRRIDQGIKNANVQNVLDRLFDRLYVLRNQLLHGGATWQGSVNRRQVNNGAAIMRLLVPYFINIMLSHPDAGWGEPYYSPHRAWQHNSPKI